MKSTENVSITASTIVIKWNKNICESRIKHQQATDKKKLKHIIYSPHQSLN